MRLLVVSDYGYITGGIEEMVNEFVSRAADKYECEVLTWELPSRFPRHACPVVMPEHGDHRAVWDAFVRAEVVVIMTSFNVRLLARLATEFLAKSPRPAITVVHTSAHSVAVAGLNELQDGWLRQLTQRTKVIAVSDAVRDALVVLAGSEAAAATIDVVQNGARMRGQRSSRCSRRRVLFVGRPVPQKGFDLYERLARELAGAELEFRANTVSIPSHDQLPEISYSYGLSDQELQELFDYSDLLVAPYLKADGMPLAVLEAINCGLPVLGFDTPGLRATLEEFDQPAIPPFYDRLRRAVLDWHSGDFDWTAPAGGKVRSWTDATNEYFAIIDGMT